jgi:amino acid permease
MNTQTSGCWRSWYTVLTRPQFATYSLVSRLIHSTLLSLLATEFLNHKQSIFISCRLHHTITPSLVVYMSKSTPTTVRKAPLSVCALELVQYAYTRARTMCINFFTRQTSNLQKLTKRTRSSRS